MLYLVRNSRIVLFSILFIQKGLFIIVCKVYLLFINLSEASISPFIVVSSSGATFDTSVKNLKWFPQLETV